MFLHPLSSIRPPLVGISPPLPSPSPNSTVRFRASFPLSHHSRNKMTTNATENDSVEPSQKQGVSNSDPIIQYVVLRRDLIDKWPLGSIITQGCHASVAATWTHLDHVDTAAYCSLANLDSMHKVTLEVKGEQQMRNLSEKLTGGGIEHKLWIEQPENIPTCVATRPYHKSQIASFFKKLKLCK
ncbi:Peptidyl-tRNA hydrolase II (PTH2) family protein [Zostera marina]|uniref:peptidyl-tRNA hydrolase n=1 Tax=Zostera marina TaxID=29655 RepID=A0A0K9P1D7_ZOSMR|nr:Peptidyl-tRNA hydrolase II (PTH2) family protein [Zostera marina]